MHEVTSDGRTVWVNSGFDGRCLARFCPKSAEILTGIEKLGFRAERITDALLDWVWFKDTVKERFGVEIGEEHCPKWVTE